MSKQESIWEKLFEVGAEGGSLTAMGRKGGGGWTFALVRDEKTMLDLVEDISCDEANSDSLADTWDGLLEKLDRYPWTKLYPLGPFHEEFCDAIWKAVMERGFSDRFKDKWARECGVT